MARMAKVPWKDLFAAAEAARLKAYAPYSHFHVGAALWTGRAIVGGCNVENASYGLTICAERGAVAQWRAEGHTRLLAVAIMVDSGKPTPPCGMCRQVLREFGAPGVELRTRNKKGQEAAYTLGQLLPHAFTGKDLTK